MAVVEKEQESLLRISQGWMIDPNEQSFHSGRKVDSVLTTDCNRSRFYTGQQAANLTVLFAARPTDLDRRRYIGGLFWSANVTPRREHLFPPPLLCKSELATP